MPLWPPGLRLQWGKAGVSGLQQVMDLMERLVITRQFFIATGPLLKINYASGQTLGDYLWLLCQAWEERGSPGVTGRGLFPRINRSSGHRATSPRLGDQAECHWDFLKIKFASVWARTAVSLLHADYRKQALGQRTLWTWNAKLTLHFGWIFF